MKYSILESNVSQTKIQIQNIKESISRLRSLGKKKAEEIRNLKLLRKKLMRCGISTGLHDRVYDEMVCDYNDTYERINHLKQYLNEKQSYVFELEDLLKQVG